MKCKYFPVNILEGGLEGGWEVYLEVLASENLECTQKGADLVP